MFLFWTQQNLKSKKKSKKPKQWEASGISIEENKSNNQSINQSPPNSTLIVPLATDKWEQGQVIRNCWEQCKSVEIRQKQIHLKIKNTSQLLCLESQEIHHIDIIYGWCHWIQSLRWYSPKLYAMHNQIKKCRNTKILPISFRN